MLFVGTAGWSLSKENKRLFPAAGSVLESYAQRLNAVEINSSFYRPHLPSTYARWASAVPADFRFSVKLPKTISHERRLNDCGDLLAKFLGEVATLGQKLSVLLLQMPPSLALDRQVAGNFFAGLRESFAGKVAVEPRHATWFTPDASALLAEHRLCRVLADPPVPCAKSPAPTTAGFEYYRLHGSPRIYYSGYDDDRLRGYAEALRNLPEAWCVFDNTALGLAIPNALFLQAYQKVPPTY